MQKRFVLATLTAITLLMGFSACSDDAGGTNKGVNPTIENLWGANLDTYLKDAIECENKKYNK